MSVKVTQTCDGCGKQRVLRAGYRGQASTFNQAAVEGGWREVKMEVHLCPDCIDKAVRKG